MPLSNDETSDQEMIEIFVEEAGEILESMDRDLAAWRQHPSDKDALSGIRRAFHTLKGSGRMVKAMDLGELAWKVENMLNRAVEGSVPVTDRMVQLVATSRAALPSLVEAFRTQRKPDMGNELQSLMNQADGIADGQRPTAPTMRPVHAEAGEQAGAQVRRHDLEQALDRAAKRADEALQRSEMALQQVRRLATQIGATQTHEGFGRAELAPLFERVNVLGRDLAELRRTSRRPQQDADPHPRELLQSIDQRIREKLAPTEHARAEVTRELEANRHAAVSARRLAIGALLISLAVLGGAVALVLLQAG